MLTIKYISPEGVEKVFAVREIEFDRNTNGSCQKGYTASLGHVRFIYAQPCPGEVLEFVYSGTVYAMNEAGKTVAKYDLGGFPIESVPHSVSWTAAGSPVVGHTITT